MVFLKEGQRLDDKIILCDTFINKGIDVEYYQKEKKNYEKKKLSLKNKNKTFKKVFSIFIFIFLFLVFFGLVYYILKQFI
jgi:hypothetical protein